MCWTKSIELTSGELQRNQVKVGFVVAVVTVHSLVLLFVEVYARKAVLEGGGWSVTSEANFEVLLGSQLQQVS